MRDMIEERLQDLERLVLKQAERIDELEEVVALMRHVAGRDLLARVKEAEAA